jgi:hypothetical protein
VLSKFFGAQDYVSRISGDRGPPVIRFTSAGQARFYRGGLFADAQVFAAANEAACSALAEQKIKARVAADLHISEKASLKKLLMVCARCFCAFT